MKNNLFGFAKGLSGVTIGGSGGGKPVALIIVTVIVLVMAVATAFDAVQNPVGDGIDWSQPNGFICSNKDCGYITTYSRSELARRMKGFAGLGPIVIDCPKCGQNTLTQSRKCPKSDCGNVFPNEVAKCPKCGADFVQAMQEYYKTQTPTQ